MMPAAQNAKANSLPAEGADLVPHVGPADGQAPT